MYITGCNYNWVDIPFVRSGTSQVGGMGKYHLVIFTYAVTVWKVIVLKTINWLVVYVPL